MDRKGLDLADTVWTRLDRKAGAIIELTVRQLRHRVSTWVVLGVGVLMMALLLAFYIDSVRDSFEPIDNDGDSVDMDGDGYPEGQEFKYGTSDFDSSDYPGVGKFLREGLIGWNEQNRVVAGNKTWDGEAWFESIWINHQIADSPSDSYDGRLIDWNRVEECPEENQEEDFPRISWGYACEIGDIDGDGLVTFFARGKWTGEGTAQVPEGLFLEWGQYSETVYIEPEPPENYIDEDGIDCFEENGERVDCPANFRLGGSHGFDDDGDCLRDGWIPSSREDNWFLYLDQEGDEFNDDFNNNGIRCDVLWITDSDGNEVISISADSFVDEDPDDEAYIGELNHRTFIIGVGKMAFVILLGLFMPLFLALGLVRDETENGTLHFLLSKPIHRGEFILYRLMGYLVVSGSYVIGLSLLVGIVTAIIGPGDSFFRMADLPIWLGIGLSTTLVLAAYGALFNTMGLISPKYGVYACILFGVWEFAMGTFSIINPNWTVSSISITHWALQMIDAIVLMAWPDTLQLSEIEEAFMMDSGLSAFWNPPVHTLGTELASVSLLISTSVLLSVTALMIFIGQSVFSRRELM